MVIYTQKLRNSSSSLKLDLLLYCVLSSMAIMLLKMSYNNMYNDHTLYISKSEIFSAHFFTKQVRAQWALRGGQASIG